MTDTSERADSGSRLLDELSLLIDAAAERAGPWLDRVVAGGHDEHAAEGADLPMACSWCPLCALIAMLRGDRAQVAARGMERIADLVALLRAVLADRWEPGEQHMPGFRPPPRPHAATPAPHPVAEPPSRVQRIDVRRKDEPGE